MLSNVYHAATNWVKHNWKYVAAGAMVVAGGVMMATGVGGPAGMALISAGISTGIQKYQHGSVNWGHVAIDGAIGLVTAGIGGAAATGAMALTENMTSCLGRNLVVGAADGMTSGASYNALNYLTSDGPKSVGGLLKTTAAGGVSGAAIGAPLGRLTKITGAACFVADTQVLMGDGSSKAIQDVQVGDEVLAWNPATNQNEPRKVMETFVHEHVETWEVETADGQVVTSTAEHPFWVEGKGWIPVRELAPGDVLATADGSATVLRVEPTGESARVFNVRVEGLHNYHIHAPDGAGMLVHNSCISANKVNADAAADAIAARIPGSRREVGFPTAAGWRFVDVLTPNRTAIESKLGRTSLTRSIAKQILKDTMLRADPGIPVRSLEWHFSPSPVTGLSGPTKALETALKLARIGIH